MKRKIRSLGMTLVAAFAISAVMASDASAIEFHAGEAHTILKGSQTGNHSFTVGSGFGAITCKTVNFSGTTTATTETSQVLTPEYKECTDSFGRKVDPTVFGVYRLTPPPLATGVGEAHLEGVLIIWHITNGSGTTICTVTVGAQTINNAVFHNIANGDYELTTTTNNVTTETTGGILNCGVSNGHHTGGSYTGNTVLEGQNTAGGNVNITVS